MARYRVPFERKVVLQLFWLRTRTVSNASFRRNKLPGYECGCVKLYIIHSINHHHTHTEASHFSTKWYTRNCRRMYAVMRPNPTPGDENVPSTLTRLRQFQIFDDRFQSKTVIPTTRIIWTVSACLITGGSSIVDFHSH